MHIPHALRKEIDAFHDLEESSLSHHKGKYVLIKDGKPHGFFAEAFPRPAGRTIRKAPQLRGFSRVVKAWD